jgi:hypothetical protein
MGRLPLVLPFFQVKDVVAAKSWSPTATKMSPIAMMSCILWAITSAADHKEASGEFIATATDKDADWIPTETY